MGVCEGVWVNVLSSGFYLLAAFLLFRFCRRERIDDWKSRAFITLSVLVGLGSGMWHAYQTPLTSVLDTMPILAFFLLFVYAVFERMMSQRKAMYLSVAYAIVASAVFLFFKPIVENTVFQGAQGYVFSLIAVALVLAACKDKKFCKGMLIALVLFLVALVFRQIDLLVCAFVPGLHDVWHMLSACATYLAVKGILAEPGR